MEKRNNTMLLTVIAIATLLVAVIGATFAYFTSSVNGEDKSSILKVGSATLTIAYADADGDALKTEKVAEPQAGAVLTKTFTLTGNNTSDKVMKYQLSLVVTDSTFEDHNPATGKTSSNADIPVFTTDGVKDGQTVDELEGTYAGKRALSARLTHDDSSSAGAIAEVNTYVPSARDMDKRVIYVDNDTTGLMDKEVTGVVLGIGTFAAGATEATHTYTLSIFFLNNTAEIQDNDKEKMFAGYIDVSTTSADFDITK